MNEKINNILWVARDINKVILFLWNQTYTDIKPSSSAF